MKTRDIEMMFTPLGVATLLMMFFFIPINIFSLIKAFCDKVSKHFFVSLVSKLSSATMCLREHIVLTRVEMDHSDDNSLDAYCNLKLVGSS